MKKRLDLINFLNEFNNGCIFDWNSELKQVLKNSMRWLKQMKCLLTEIPKSLYNKIKSRVKPQWLEIDLFVSTNLNGVIEAKWIVNELAGNINLHFAASDYERSMYIHCFIFKVIYALADCTFMKHLTAFVPTILSLNEHYEWYIS